MVPQRLTDALGRALRRLDPDDRLRAYRLWSFWADEVGATIAAHARPVALRAGLLTVAVDSPTWLQELQFLKDTLRERINARLGQPLIEDLYFIAGTAAGVRTQQSSGEDHTAIGPPSAPIPPLRDPELAAAFTRIVEARARRARRDR